MVPTSNVVSSSSRSGSSRPEGGFKGSREDEVAPLEHVEQAVNTGPENRAILGDVKRPITSDPPPEHFRHRVEHLVIESFRSDGGCIVVRPCAP